MSKTTTKQEMLTFYRIGAVAALTGIAVVISEMLITFLPGGSEQAPTVVAWFNFFQRRPLMGLRNLGLLNMGFNVLGIPVFLALYIAHRDKGKLTAYAALTLVAIVLGVAIFFATNRAFPMLALSHQYAAAESEAQRDALMAAGQAMLAVGESHTPGTFPAFFFSEVAGILMSMVMLKGGVFSRANGYVGVLGFACLLIFEVAASFVWSLGMGVMLLAMVGGLLNVAWYIMLALKLWRLDQ